MDIFDEGNKHLQIAETIQKHLGFKPLFDDTISTVVCVKCWLKIFDFHQFFKSVEYAQNNYNLLQLQDGNGDNVDETVLNVKVELDDQLQEQIMEVDFDNTSALDRKNVQDSNNQKNPLDEIEIHEAAHFSDPVKDDDESLSIENALDEAQNAFSSSDEEFLAALKKRNKITKRKIKRKPNRQVTKSTKAVKSTKCGVRQDTAHIEALIKKHIPMVCSLCIFVGQVFSDIVQHFRKSHPKQKPFVTCCERKFSKRCYLTQHALKHENPDHFKCHECQKTFSNDSGLRVHTLAYHAPEEQRLYACDECQQRFATKHLLELHKASHIPREERSYFCDKCPTKKAFASEYLLQIHNNMRHKREANVCHVCAKSIRCKRSFEKHVRLHFEDSGPRVKCPYPDCESWLKDEENLKQHLNRHNPEGKIYKCPQCDKVCKNRRALTSHKLYSHSNEIFPCDQCGKTFKKAITLKEHMAQHTGETLYKCPFCTRTFNSNANMHAHKKKMHPVEWDEWRKSKRGSSQLFINNNNSSMIFCDNDICQQAEEARRTEGWSSEFVILQFYGRGCQHQRSEIYQFSNIPNIFGNQETQYLNLTKQMLARNTVPFADFERCPPVPPPPVIESNLETGTIYPRRGSQNVAQFERILQAYCHKRH
uniref:C2H2-type domain-containing protein n=1 Tax=Glossina pallidipes TaxID=7398 RepID=A0A1B0AF82_GLOPL